MKKEINKNPNRPRGSGYFYSLQLGKTRQSLGVLNPVEANKSKSIYFVLFTVLLLIILFLFFYSVGFSITGRQVSETGRGCNVVSCEDVSNCIPYSDAAFSTVEEINNINGYREINCYCDDGTTFLDREPCFLNEDSGRDDEVYFSPSQESLEEVEEGEFEETFEVGELKLIRQVVIYNKETNDKIATAEIKEDKFNFYFSQGKDFYPEHCSNGLVDFDEEAVDCGQECEKCGPMLSPKKNKINTWWMAFLVSVLIYLHIQHQPEEENLHEEIQEYANNNQDDENVFKLFGE